MALALELMPDWFAECEADEHIVSLEQLLLFWFIWRGVEGCMIAADSLEEAAAPRLRLILLNFKKFEWLRNSLMSSLVLI